jgi:hypothetical protein
MRALVAAAAVLALASTSFAQTSETPKPAPKATCHAQDGKACVKTAAKRRKNDGTDQEDAPAARCRDVRTHRFTKCGGPYAEPVPAS